jgi:ceramide glucosyltransferase
MTEAALRRVRRGLHLHAGVTQIGDVGTVLLQGETMTSLDALLLAFCLIATSLHVITTALAMQRCRPPREVSAPPDNAPFVTILRPVCGVDDFEEATLRSGFELDYPDYELVFCCADAADPAAALVRELIARHPRVRARLLVGRDAICANPKLNNLVKGWPHARGDWLIFADSNVLMPPDYIQRLLAGWRPGTGVLCAPPIGGLPAGFGSELECAFLNTYQARWQYAADAAGFGFAQGKTMLWRRRDLVAAGGIGALACEIAEDAAATKVVRSLGLRASLVDAPFMQPLGTRSLRQVWDRQARWSRLRRVTFPLLFAPEVLTGGLLPVAAGTLAADAIGVPAPAALAVLAAVWLGGEALLARTAGWHLSLRSPLAWLVRDALLPALWLQAWLSAGFNWRGNEVRPETRMQPT